MTARRMENNPAPLYCQHGYIAQWLQRLTADQQLPGSNPGVPFYVLGLPMRRRCATSFLAKPYCEKQVCGRAAHCFSNQSHSLHSDICLGLAWCRSDLTRRPNKQGPDAHVAHRVVVIKFAQRAYWRARLRRAGRKPSRSLQSCWSFPFQGLYPG